MPKITSFLIVLGLGLTTIDAHAEDVAATALSSQGSAEKGKLIFNQCRACHNLTSERPHKIGPNLTNIFSRHVGSVADYPRYSQALSEADFTWDEERLDQWLTSPRSFLPGTKMSFAGLRRDQDRKDVIAYLRQATLDDKTP